MEDANIRVFTEKDFDSLKFDFTRSRRSKSTEPCLLKVKLSTYGIGNISMEYNWNKKGTNLQKTYLLRSFTFRLTSFFWLLNRVIFIKLTRVL